MTKTYLQAPACEAGVGQLERTLELFNHGRPKHQGIGETMSKVCERPTVIKGSVR